jgi:hypothetical protein
MVDFIPVSFFPWLTKDIGENKRCTEYFGESKKNSRDPFEKHRIQKFVTCLTVFTENGRKYVMVTQSCHCHA